MKIREKLLMGVILSLAVALFSAKAMAVPFLQLDIGGGTYAPGPEDIITKENVFTVYAYATPGSGATTADINAILADEYFLSIAVTPKVTSGSNLGSIEVGTDTIAVTGGMVFGTPQIGIVADSLNLSSHGIFETYFYEKAFQFSTGDTSGIYNTQVNAGSGPIAGNGMFFVAFDIDKTLLNPNFQLHFDLYNTAVKTFKGTGTIAIDDFAPFSHDASTVVPIPEPTTMLLLGIGLVGLAGAEVVRRRRKKKAVDKS